MTNEKLYRIMEELDRIKDNRNIVKYRQIEAKIMKWCGTNPKTIQDNLTALQKFKWLKRLNRWEYRIGEEFKVNESDMF